MALAAKRFGNDDEDDWLHEICARSGEMLGFGRRALRWRCWRLVIEKGPEVGVLFMRGQ